MYTDYISYRAAIQPHISALSGPGGDVTYAEFDARINQTANALSTLLSGRQILVGVRIEDEYLSWLTVLALGRLGHVSASIHLSNPAGVMEAAPDLVLADNPQLGTAGPDHIQLTREWWQSSLSAPRAATNLLASDNEPARLTVSSGTTGRPKRVILTNRQITGRIAHYALTQAANIAAGQSTRLLITMGPASIGGFLGPLLVWSTGGTVLLGRSGQISYRSLISLGVTTLVMSTGQLKQLMDALPPQTSPISHLAVAVGGSIVSHALSQSVRLRLTPNLMLAYGSTEAGNVASGLASALDTEGGAVGVCTPGVEVEIVDERDVRMPESHVGIVRIRSSTAPTSYLGNEEASAEAFKDGWFYPGDLGSIDKAGVLYITGRTSNLLNLGGVKISAESLDEVMAHAPGVRDAAAFSVPDQSGAEQAYLAVVRSENFSPEKLLEFCRTQLPNLPPVQIVMFTSIPRNEMGKVQRAKLQEAVTSGGFAHLSSNTPVA